jgi:hypothetical protein
MNSAVRDFTSVGGVVLKCQCSPAPWLEGT